MINAALGFDTFLVVRHGVKSEVTSMEVDETHAAAEPSTSAATSRASMASYQCIPGCELGCYFCNDVVAPGDVS